MKNDDLSSLNSEDIEWITQRVARYFEKEIEAPKEKIDSVNIERLTDVVKQRLDNADQLEVLAHAVAQKMRDLAAAGCSGGNPNCACASHRHA